jgi:acyl carrier protein
MTESELRGVVLEVLGEVAPEADLERLDPAADLRDELEIDSIDFLNFVIGVHERTGIEIPEADYGKLSTLDACVSYLLARTDG